MFMANFLLALREGVEAALVVGILVGYIVKVGRRDVLPKVWLGVVLAAVIPLALGAYMTWGPYTLTFKAQEILGGSLSIVAVIFVTWMIFWMARNSRRLSQSIREDAAAALSSGSTWTLVWLAVLSVGREGIETAVFVWATVKSSATTGVAAPALGVLTGLLCAIVVGYLVYRGSTAINIRKFFAITGYLLIFVAAGVVCYGIGDLQEASVIPGWGTLAYDFITPVADYASTWWFVLLDAMFNFKYLLGPTHIQIIGWLIYLIPTLVLFTAALKKPIVKAGAAHEKPADVKTADVKTAEVTKADATFTTTH